MAIVARCIKIGVMRRIGSSQMSARLRLCSQWNDCRNRRYPYAIVYVQPGVATWLGRAYHLSLALSVSHKKKSVRIAECERETTNVAKPHRIVYYTTRLIPTEHQPLGTRFAPPESLSRQLALYVGQSRGPRGAHGWRAGLSLATLERVIRRGRLCS